MLRYTSHGMLEDVFWRMKPVTRKWLLFSHVVCSVGWVGIELSILTLGIIGQVSAEATVVRSAHVVAGMLGWLFYFPASLFAGITGILLSLGTKWGLVRYRWVLVKLVITLALFTGGNLLVVPQFVLGSQAATRGEELGRVATMLVTAMIAGLVLLLIATLLSFLKPWGTTRWHPTRAR